MRPAYPASAQRQPELRTSTNTHPQTVLVRGWRTDLILRCEVKTRP